MSNSRKAAVKKPGFFIVKEKEFVGHITADEILNEQKKLQDLADSEANKYRAKYPNHRFTGVASIKLTGDKIVLDSKAADEIIRMMNTPSTKP
jgi:hypothetical protein